MQAIDSGGGCGSKCVQCSLQLESDQTLCNGKATLLCELLKAARERPGTQHQHNCNLSPPRICAASFGSIVTLRDCAGDRTRPRT